MRTRNLCWIVLFSLVMDLQDLQARERKLFFQHLGMNEGLSDNSVYCIFNDSRGFMWFGTKNGLNRYDGNEIRVFNKELNAQNTLGNNTVYVLEEDADGKIWVGTFSGVYIYDPVMENFTLFNQETEAGSKITGLITEIVRDKEDNLWIAENSVALYRYNYKEGLLQEFRHESGNPNSIGPGHISHVLVGKENEIWVSLHDEGVFRYNPFSATFTNLTSQQEELKKAQIRVLADGDSVLYIGTKNGGLKSFSKSDSQIQDLITTDENGNPVFVRDLKIIGSEVWVASESGLFIYNPLDQTFQNLKNDITDPLSISDNALYYLHRDKNGGIWIGTYFSGLNYLPNQGDYFEKFYPHSRKNSLTGKRVREFVEDDEGILWIGTEDAGISRFDPKTWEFKSFTPDKSGKSISYHNIHGLAIENNNLVIGVWSQGLNELDLHDLTIRKTSFSNPAGYAIKEDIFAIHIDSRKNKWIGTANGLYLYDPKNDHYENVTEIGNQFVYDILEDEDGSLWIGTLYGGLFHLKITHNARNVTGYYPDENSVAGLPHFSVITLLKDKDGIIWLGTEGGGFCRVNQNGSGFTCYGPQNGFPARSIYKILQSDDDMLWMSTNKGLMEFDIKKESYRLYTKDNGLINAPFNYKSGIKTKDGTLYFGTLNGFLSFKPTTFAHHQPVAPVVFTDLFLANTRVPITPEGGILSKSITYSPSVTLNYDQNSLGIGFSVLHYSGKNSIQYAYILEGFDRDWTYLDRNQKINYTFLPPGRYKLKVKASDTFGNWMNEEASLQIEILPPFWLTNWAFLCYTLLALLAIYYLAFQYKRRLTLRHMRTLKYLEDEKEREMYQSKIQFFTHITHEIRTPLTLIKAPLEYLLGRSENMDEESKENLLTMDKNTTRLIDLTNQLLDFRKSERGGFDPSFIRTDVIQLLEETYFRFKVSAQQRGLNFFLENNSGLVFADIDREAVTKILSNMISNAIKNAEALVKISVALDMKNLKISVTNDGELIPASLSEKIFEPFFQVDAQNKNDNANPGTGLGLPLARSLAEMHGGSLHLQPSDTKFNIFSLTLPLVQKKAIKLASESFADREAETSQQSHSSHQKPSLLVVEDYSDLLDFLAQQLRENYIVYKARNGSAALELLEKHPVDLIICDVMMPIMDGLDLCRAVKSNVEYSHIPVVMLTAKNTLQSKIEGLEKGADIYLEKPFSIEHVKLQVRNLLIYRDKIRKAYASEPMAQISSIANTRADEEFLKSVNEAILANIDTQQFGVNELADHLCMSQSSLLRKIKGIANMTPNGYIRLVRLKKAAELLQSGEYTIAQVAEMVGFNSPSYFTKCFQHQFGLLPKSYISTLEEN